MSRETLKPNSLLLSRRTMNKHNRTKIRATEYGDLICWCGNEPILEGFYPCNSAGEMVEPTPEDWTPNSYVCDRCGRIIDLDTLKITGYRQDNILSLTEREEIDQTAGSR